MYAEDVHVVHTMSTEECQAVMDLLHDAQASMPRQAFNNFPDLEKVSTGSHNM
jgi:hypothetical protein